MPIADVEKIVRHEPLDSCYEIGKELGRGKFAIVKKCTEKKTGAQYAAKILKKRRRGKSVREDILMEIDIMRQGMDHPRIIKLYEVFETQSEFYIIIELALGGELFRVIAVDPLPELKARDVVFQILEGVRHLHTLNIVHMDLKPENLLLYRKNMLEIKIVDFGLAVQLQEGQEMKSLVGTAEYVSPEILSFEALSTYSDMWSIGALTYALLAGYSPFQGETHQETFLNVSTCDYDFEDDVFEVVSSDAKDFIEKLLVRPPKKRLTAERCLQHPWIKAHIQSTNPTNNNLDGSMSSLDSALCMDSASSMEPSPVSSASSSFSPAPSATSHSRASGTTATVTTSSTTAASSSSSSSSANQKQTTTISSDFSRPEDMKKVTEKLGQISKLATEQIIAETATKPRPEGSPTSTASSTSTLRGGDDNEATLTVAPLLESLPPPPPPSSSSSSSSCGGQNKTDDLIRPSSTIDEPDLIVERRTASFEHREEEEKKEEEKKEEVKEKEREKTPEVPSFKSATLSRLPRSSRENEKSTNLLNTSSSSSSSSSQRYKSVTLGRDASPARRNGGGEEGRRTPSFGRDSPKMDDVTTLDPKTIESLEKFQRLKERSRSRESESYIRPLTPSKDRSPDLSSRRRSEGVTGLSPSERRMRSKSPDISQISSTISEEKSRYTSSSSSSSCSSREKTASPLPTTTTNLRSTNPTTSATSSSSSSLTPRTSSPKAAVRSVSPELSVKTELHERSPSPSPLKIEEKKEEEKEEEEETEVERARKEREKAREERRRARKEEDKRKEEEMKKQREEAEKKLEEERRRMELEREKARDVRRREREKKLAQRNNSSGSGSSESIVKVMDRNKWAWSIEARSQTNDEKPHPKEAEPDTSEDPKMTPSQEKESQKKEKERKPSASEFFQFGIDYSKKSTTNTQAPPPLQTSSPVAKATEKKDTSPRSDSPMVIISPPPTPEVKTEPAATPPPPPSGHQHGEFSPVTEHKLFKTKRMTPVISSDAIEAILRGDVDDDSVLHYPTQPNPFHSSQLETCPEEYEPPTTTRTKSPSPLLKETRSNGYSSSSSAQGERRDGTNLPSALKDPNRSASPDKRRVTLLTSNERTHSEEFDRTLSPEGSDVTTSPSPDSLSVSFDAGRFHGSAKPDGVSRLTVSSSYSSLSRSTPDLSDVLGGGGGKKRGKEGRKVERSSSRRLGLSRSRMDSYVTSTEYSSSYYHSPTSHVMKSGRHATVTSRLLSGGKGFLSKWNESKATRQNHKVSSS